MSDQIAVPAVARVPAPPVAGLRKRYAVKIVAAVAAALTGIAVDALASRGLGPANYGQFYFLQQFFAQILTLMSGSISLAFVVRSARRPGSRGFTFVYLIWLLAIPLLVEAFVILADFAGFARYLWPNTTILYVQLAAVASYLLFLGREGTGMGDAYGLTVPTEWARVIQRILAFGLIVGLYAAHVLRLQSFFLYTCFANAALVVGLFIVLRRHHKLEIPRRPFRASALRAAAGQYFYEYCSPLVVYLIFTFAAALFDRWLLQVVAGSTSQGFFSLAYQISQMMLLFVTAFVPLLMREMSIAHGVADLERLRSLFKRSLDNLYFLSGFFACFVAVFCDQISILVGGALFSASALPVALVVLSAMHRTYGQVTSTLYYAVGKTGLFRNIAIVTSLGGILMTYALVGSPRYLGLGLGANGLAIKTFLYEILTVNAFTFFAARFLELNYWRILLQQIVCAASLIGVAAIVRVGVSVLPIPAVGQASRLVTVGIAAVLYGMAVVILVCVWPGVAGLERRDIRRFRLRLIRGI